MSNTKISVNDIHPRDVSDKFDELMLDDINILLLDQESFLILMPSCQYFSQKAFTYQGLNYKRCNQCETLYISLAPTEARHLQFLSSKAMAYWRNSLPTTLVESRKSMYQRGLICFRYT